MLLVNPGATIATVSLAWVEASHWPSKDHAGKRVSVFGDGYPFDQNLDTHTGERDGRVGAQRRTASAKSPLNKGQVRP